MGAINTSVINKYSINTLGTVLGLYAVFTALSDSSASLSGVLYLASSGNASVSCTSAPLRVRRGSTQATVNTSSSALRSRLVKYTTNPSAVVSMSTAKVSRCMYQTSAVHVVSSAVSSYYKVKLGTSTTSVTSTSHCTCTMPHPLYTVATVDTGGASAMKFTRMLRSVAACKTRSISTNTVRADLKSSGIVISYAQPVWLKSFYDASSFSTVTTNCTTAGAQFFRKRHPAIKLLQYRMDSSNGAMGRVIVPTDDTL